MQHREQRLARTFVELADTLVDDFDVVDILTLVAERCVELLDVAAAGLLLADARGRLQPMAATSAAGEEVELLQAARDEGPCPECYRSARQVLVPDLAAEADRWPGFVPSALAVGFRSTHALPLRLRGDVLGAMNLFGAAPGSLPAADLSAAQALADVATIAILQHRATREARALAVQLQEALDSRVAIEQAKGVIAERAGIEIAEAFVHLRRYARANGRRLTEVAQAVIDGSLPPATILR